MSMVYITLWYVRTFSLNVKGSFMLVYFDLLVAESQVDWNVLLLKFQIW